MRLSNKHIFIYLVNTLTVYSSSKGQLPLWTWDCIDDKCIPTKAMENEKLQSLVTCKMLCASFQLWPKPTGAITISNTAVTVRAVLFHFKILSFPSIHVREHLIEAFELFRQDLRKIENNISVIEPRYRVEIRVAINESGSDDPRMLFDTDESYRLQFNSNNLSAGYLIVDITSNSFCGARHALETLSQLVWLDPYIGSLLMVDAASIEDAPRFPYRGLMLDTVRNYFSTYDIIRTIDVMAATKLNTFHWHVSDSQGLSVDLKSLSQLAYYKYYTQGLMYSPDDVRKIARHARIRGIRVLLEIDLSAIMCNDWNWGLTIEHNVLAQRDGVEPANAQNSEFVYSEINVNNQRIYNAIENMYAEIIHLTGADDIFHLGGEGVCKFCLQHSNATASNDLKLQFTRNVLQCLESVIKKLPKLIILWSNNLSERIKIYLKPYLHGLGIQVRNAPWTKKYIYGKLTIISHEDFWDLNSGCEDWDADSGSANYNSWQRIYEHRPWSWRNKGLLGGEATVWSSTLSAGGLEARVWPRLAALGERLWSDHAEGATQVVQTRLDVHRSRLCDRGIQTAPLWSMWCTQNAC